MNAFSDFTGEGLTFHVAGPGVSIDPVAGTLAVATDQLRAGVEVTVTATNSGGAAVSRFRLTVAALPLDMAPVLIAAPTVAVAVAGVGTIGSPLTVLAGTWGGEPVPTLAFQWRCDGIDVPDATGTVYVPGPETDGKSVSARVTASNVAGSLAAETPALPIAWPAPAAPGTLADLDLAQGTAARTIEAAAAFEGSALVFAVSGGGASIDPATGRVTVPADVTRTAETVTVTATNSGGSASAAFRVTVRVVAVAPSLVVAAPVLSGTGRIGAPVTLEPGVWSGVPAPQLDLEWLRDGVAIAGATAAVYVPVDADDLTDLAARVTARNVAGSATATTEPLAILQPAPLATATLAGITLVQGGAAAVVETGGAFAGARLVFTATGGGALVDAATGAVTLPADTLRSAETVTVTATNSGGAASAGFAVSVVAALLPPTTVGTLPNAAWFAGTGVQTLSAETGFAGTELVYGLDAAPAGVSIDPASGLVSVSTAAAIAPATVTVRAANAAGAAVQSFGILVRATTSIFDAAAALGDLGFVANGTAPSWSLQPEGFCRLVPAAPLRAHGQWALAAGDGLYRGLLRWTSAIPTTAPYVPVVFGARIGLDQTNYTGLFVQAFQGATGGPRLRLQEYTGTGATTVQRAAATVDWQWNVWSWFEIEIAGKSVKARVYAETAPAPAWQLAGILQGAIPQGGAFGPGAFTAGTETPAIDIRRLEFAPLPGMTPAAAADADWSPSQIAVQTGGGA